MLKTNCAICGSELIEDADFDSDERRFYDNIFKLS